MGRTIVVRSGDVLVLGGYKVDASVLRVMLNPRARMLWAVIEKDGRVQLTPYNEERVIWLQESDLERVDAS